MPDAFSHEPSFLTTMADGTLKQINPFSGTEVWTVPRRGNRPLGLPVVNAVPVTAADHTSSCAFCAGRYLETPPEKARIVRGPNGDFHPLREVLASQLFETTAEFRRVPNLFEIMAFDYWRANYGYRLPEIFADWRSRYLDEPGGLEHVERVVQAKLKAAGRQEVSGLSREELLEESLGFFGGGHDVIIARRHFVDGATDNSQLASSGTLTPDEHNAFLAFTVESAYQLLANNRYARYVAVFQNWLKPAGASFDHLHKQLVAIDERGSQHEMTLGRLRKNPNVFNEFATNYAGYHNLVLAESDYAIAFAGFGHRYPTIEIYSKSEHSNPWDHSAAELRGMSDMIHAMHAATGAHVPCNEEWHYRPVDVTMAMPWRVLLKWRVSTLAGFEGATKIYLNTIGPYTLRDQVVPRLFALRDEGAISVPNIAFECPCTPNALRYHQGR